jgi:uncharacterized protein (DUF1919 family)
MIISKIFSKLNRALKNYFYLVNKNKKFKKYSNKLKKNDFTIISSNCIAGTIYHDLNLKFLSPTINLYIEAYDFIKFCNNLKEYLSYDLIELQSFLNYPVGMLNDIKIHFMHYKKFSEAKIKWNERSKRINFNNIRVIMVDRDFFSPTMIENFLKIPYKKVIFSSQKLEIKENFQIESKYFKNHVGILTDFVDFKGNRAYESNFNITDFLN